MTDEPPLVFVPRVSGGLAGLDAKHFGSKAKGLQRVPRNWTLPFFLLSSTLHSRYIAAGRVYRSLLLENLLQSDELQTFEKALFETSGPEGSDVIVRSSAVDEGLAERGSYRSEVCRATVEAVSLAIEQVFSSCGNDPGRMALIVQLWRRRQASGHLSNERRITRKPSVWLCEYDTISGVGSPRVDRMACHSGLVTEEGAPLNCSSKHELSIRLRQAAGWAYKLGDRLHFEWVWDGGSLWLVQADQAPDACGERPSALEFSTAPANAVTQLETLQPEATIPEGLWPKLDCVKVFRRCGLPTTALWVLSNRRMLAQLRKGTCPPRLQRDLGELLTSPIVVRADVSRGGSEDDFMLPRTDTVSTMEQAIAYLTASAKELSSERGARKPCFIFHRFIPARSSAFALAEPSKKRVRIDGLWGLPDGLGYYPHDSFELSCDGKGPVAKHVRFKEEFLDCDSQGLWVPKQAGAPFDWRQSLTDDELSDLARGTYQVARDMNAPVQLMWFVGVPQQCGHPACLPWFSAKQEPPRNVRGSTSIIASRGFLVRTTEDVEVLKTNHGRTATSIRLRPIPELLRSRKFIDLVAAVAMELEVPVELEGSVLAHAYYLLRRAGASVVCSNPLTEVPKRQRFDKLVRDLIPVNIESRGERVRSVRLSGQQLTAVLKAKVVEEALELFWSEGIEDGMEEVVDLQEVVASLCKHLGYADEELRRLAAEKREKRGGFDKGLVLKETQEVPLITVAAEGAGLFDELSDVGNLVPGHAVGVADSPPRLRGQTMTIPLIPPAPEHRYFGRTFIVKSLGLSLQVQFGQKDVIVEIAPLQEEPPARPSGQLELFGGATD